MSLLDLANCAPQRWRHLGEFYEVTKKPRRLDMSAFETIPFAPMEVIPQDGTYAPIFVTKSLNTISSGTYFERGDVLVAKITPSFENGKQALVQNLTTPFGYATTEVIPLRARGDGQDQRFLFFYLLHPDIRHYVAERMEGSTGRQRVPDDVLLNLPFPEFGHNEQSSIANVLELIQRAVTAETGCENITRNLKHAAMATLFTRGLRGEAQKETEVGLLPESWSVVQLGSIGRVGNGSTPKKSISDYWIGGTYPWLTSAKVYDREIVKADQYVTQQALSKCHLPRIGPGAVLIAITGQGKTLGHCAVLSIEATVSQHIAYVATDTSRANPSFVRGYLETQYNYFRQIASGGGSTKGALTCAFLRDKRIPLPPLDQQQEIVGILEAIDCKVELHSRKRAVLVELFKSLLHKLMTGEVHVNELDLSALECSPLQEVAA